MVFKTRCTRWQYTLRRKQDGGRKSTLRERLELDISTCSSSSSSFQLTAACSFSRQPISSPKKKVKPSTFDDYFTKGEGKGNSERKNELRKTKRGFAYSAVIAVKESKTPGGSSVKPLSERDLQSNNEQKSPASTQRASH